MIRRTASTVAALALGLLFLSPTPASAQKSSLNREKGAVYVEDLTKKTLQLRVKSPAPAYSDARGRRAIGTLLAGQQVELIAFTEKACRVRGKAAHDNIVGWVGTSFLETDDGTLFDRLRQAAERAKQVQELIDKKEVAIGMTPDEVIESLGKPDAKESNITANGTTGSLSWVTYDRVPQRNVGRDRYGRLIETVTYIKVETGRLTVNFENGTVSSIQATKGKPNWNNSRIVVPPIIIR